MASFSVKKPLGLCRRPLAVTQARSPSGRPGGPTTPSLCSWVLLGSQTASCSIFCPRRGPEDGAEGSLAGFPARQRQPWGVQSRRPLGLGVCGSLPLLFGVEGGPWLRKKAQAGWLRL